MREEEEETANQDHLTQAAEEWDRLADDEIRRFETGIQDCKQIADARAALYRRTAKALRIRRDTGIEVCACCLKPFKDHRG
jgi:hypothetical protein